MLRVCPWECLLILYMLRRTHKLRARSFQKVRAELLKCSAPNSSNLAFIESCFVQRYQMGLGHNDATLTCISDDNLLRSVGRAAVF